MQRFTMTKPDDWHLHLRDGEALRAVVSDSATRFARAIVMPNLKPPVVDTRLALAYRDRILAALPRNVGFEPLMSLYLTDKTSPLEIRRARDSGAVFAVKYYPAGATTNSEHGVTDIRNCLATLEVMADIGMPLLVHGEVAEPDVDVFDRERIFIERTLIPLLRHVPRLRVVMEHITTVDAVKLILAAPDNIGATITAHHLLLNRNALFDGGIRPHHYCLPVLKREEHRLALVEAVTSGSPKFFLGTDSAPHARHTKETGCGCAGIYTAHAGIELYAEAFEAAGRLDRLEAFASFHGADFYGLPRNREQIALLQREWSVPEEVPFGQSTLVPFRAGSLVRWALA